MSNNVYGVYKCHIIALKNNGYLHMSPMVWVYILPTLADDKLPKAGHYSLFMAVSPLNAASPLTSSQFKWEMPT